MPNLFKAISKVIQRRIGSYSVFALNVQENDKTQLYPLLVEDEETETLIVVPISYEGDLGLAIKLDLVKENSLSAFPEINVPLSDISNQKTIVNAAIQRLNLSEGDISEVVIDKGKVVVLPVTHRKVRTIYVFLNKDVKPEGCHFFSPLGSLFKHSLILDYVDVFTHQALMSLVISLRKSSVDTLNDMSGPFIQGSITRDSDNPYDQESESEAFKDWFEGRGFALNDQGEASLG